MDTKKTLAQAALDLLRKKLPDDMTISDIATASGANRSLVNYHFGSKDCLVDHVVRGLVTEGRHHAPSPPDASPRERVRAMISEDMERMNGVPGDDRLCDSVRAVVSAPGRYPLTAEAIRECSGDLLEAIEESAGRPLHPDEKDLAVIAYMTAFHARRIGMPDHRIADLVSNMLVKGVGNA